MSSQFSFIDEGDIRLFKYTWLALFCYLTFHQFNRMGIRKALEDEAVAHNLDHCFRISVYQVRNIQGVFQGNTYKGSPYYLGNIR